MQHRMLLIIASVTAAVCLQSCESSTTTSAEQAASGAARAPLVDGSGTYSRPISTASEAAQKFFDQ